MISTYEPFLNSIVYNMGVFIYHNVNNIISKSQIVTHCVSTYINKFYANLKLCEFYLKYYNNLCKMNVLKILFIQFPVHRFKYVLCVRGFHSSSISNTKNNNVMDSDESSIHITCLATRLY